MTDRGAVWPLLIVVPNGWVVIVGAVPTVTVAVVLLAVWGVPPNELLTCTQ